MPKAEQQTINNDRLSISCFERRGHILVIFRSSGECGKTITATNFNIMNQKKKIIVDSPFTPTEIEFENNIIEYRINQLLN